MDPTSEDANASRVAVTGLAAPDAVDANGTVAVRVTLENLGTSKATRNVTVAFGSQRERRSVTLANQQGTTITVRFALGEPGTYRIRAGDLERSITVLGEDVVRVGAVPETVPPNATLLVPVSDAGGDPVADATVSVGDRTATTDGSGVARLRTPPRSGEYDLRASAPDATTTRRSITVERGAPRVPTATLSVDPSAPTILTRPVATVALSNPWNRSIATTLRVRQDGRSPPALQRELTLEPGERTTVRTRLNRGTAGDHTVTVDADGRQVWATEYVVRGNGRVAAAAATSGRYAPGSGLSRAIRSVFGNFELLLATLAGLVALATVGTITAAFARAVYARRQTIGIRRATGASPTQVTSLVLADAARLGLLSTGPALVLGTLSVTVLELAGLTTVFGISVVPADPWPVLAASGVSGVVLALCGAALATIPMVRCQPARLLD